MSDPDPAPARDGDRLDRRSSNASNRRSSDAFDVHAVRHRLKLVRDAGDVSLYENRDGVACPGCGEPFAELLISAERTRRFSPSDGAAFCVVHEPDRFLVCTHERS